jgi:hypothetical protein
MMIPEDYENDPLLDWDYEQRKQRPLTLQQLEERLAFWRERQNRLYLELYRAATSI